MRPKGLVCGHWNHLSEDSLCVNTREKYSPNPRPEGVHCTYYYPRHKGNIGRFINHSCEPNLSVVPVRIRNSIPHLCLFASRDISEATEVTYDYGHGSAVSDSENSGTVCRCGAAMCKGFLPGDNVF